MDRLDSAITALRIEIDKDERALAEKRVRLTALLEAADMRPAQERHSALRHTGEARRIGRAPGSISKEWRRYLSAFVDAGNIAMPRSEFVRRAAAALGMAEASARQRMRQYIEAGHLIEDASGVLISRSAIERFELRAKTNEGHTVSDVTSNGSGLGMSQRVPSSIISCDPQADRH